MADVIGTRVIYRAVTAQACNPNIFHRVYVPSDTTQVRYHMLK